MSLLIKYSYMLLGYEGNIFWRINQFYILIYYTEDILFFSWRLSIPSVLI